MNRMIILLTFRQKILKLLVLKKSDDDHAADDFREDDDNEDNEAPLLNWERAQINAHLDASRFQFTKEPGITVDVNERWTQLDYLKLFIVDE